MPKLRIDNLGEAGLNSDIEKTLLPPNAVTLLKNVVCNSNSLQAAAGHAELFKLDIEPLYQHVWENTVELTADPAEAQYVIVSDGKSVIAYDMRGDPITLVNNAWTGGYVSFTDLNGILIVNSTTQGPFYWAGPPTASLTALPGWGAQWRCREMVAHRYGLFALGMLADDNPADPTGPKLAFPHKLRWSNSAQEGSVPASWDGTDLTKDAGDDILGETSGAIIGGVRSRGYLYIIKEDAIYQARRVDGAFIYAIERLQGTVGTTAQKGYCEAEGQIAVLTKNDVLLFDGQRQRSLTDHRVSMAMETLMSEQFFSKSQLVFSKSERKVYAAFSGGGPQLTESLIYNLNDNTWSHQNFVDSYGLSFGYTQYSGSDPLMWDDLVSEAPGGARWVDAGTWDDQTVNTWNHSIYSPSERQLFSFESKDVFDVNGAITGREYRLAMRLPDKWTDADDTPLLCRVQRTGIKMQEQGGLSLIKAVWFDSRAKSSLDTTPKVRFKVGMQDDLGGQIRWAQSRTGSPADLFEVDLSSDNFIDPRIQGRYLCWEVQSEANVGWWLSALTFDWEPAGER